MAPERRRADCHVLGSLGRGLSPFVYQAEGLSRLRPRWTRYPTVRLFNQVSKVTWRRRTYGYNVGTVGGERLLLAAFLGGFGPCSPPALRGELAHS